MSNVILTQLQQNIAQQDYDAAKNLMPLLNGLFPHQAEANNVLHHLQELLDEHDPKSQQLVTDLKNILVG